MLYIIHTVYIVHLGEYKAKHIQSIISTEEEQLATTCMLCLLVCALLSALAWLKVPQLTNMSRSAFSVCMSLMSFDRQLSKEHIMDTLAAISMSQIDLDVYTYMCYRMLGVCACCSLHFLRLGCTLHVWVCQWTGHFAGREHCLWPLVTDQITAIYIRTRTYTV